ncbi:ankyrin repeats (3 copies) domain-containing protein [Trichoderma breve]|uniref:Ankyrin repeats (3 copies) domain-containing protein n=1 Tax=Trichoderma breve TaxID=2034170 RepID=A0A9W9EBT9_9HYPO|nr:ankyrin repeats (3 copies) domain-containing protein [Trichoderma breve]KAJ4863846.1 ankyrin repeats (3 copies) domain-containing protein [Trichoderma breve]
MAFICAGLVTIEEESGIIRLIHYTTHEYLERTRERWLPDAESSITIICTTYLSLQDFDTGPCEPCTLEEPDPGMCYDNCEYQKRLRLFPLYGYAANYWGHHARACVQLNEEVMNFLSRQSNVGASAQVLMTHWSFRGRCKGFPTEMTGLHMASHLGIYEAVNAILKYEALIDRRDSHGTTPLSYAASGGHQDIVELLLATGKVDPDSGDKDFRTPLLYAAMGGHEDVVKLLLATGKLARLIQSLSVLFIAAEADLQRRATPLSADKKGCQTNTHNW